MTDLFRSRDKLLPLIPRQNYFWLKHATSRWIFLTGSNVKNIHPQSFSSPGNDNSIRITLEYDTCGVQRNPNSRHERVPRYHWLDVVFFPIADTNVWDPEGKMLAVLAEPLSPFLWNQFFQDHRTCYKHGWDYTTPQPDLVCYLIWSIIPISYLNVWQIWPSSSFVIYTGVLSVKNCMDPSTDSLK